MISAIHKEGSMRCTNLSVLLAVLMMSGLLACDFYPGSRYRSQNSVRTWTSISGGNCLLAGSYTFRQDLQVPEFSGIEGIRLRPESKDDIDSLPQQVSIQYDLNSSFFLQTDFELNPRGRGRFRHRKTGPFSFNDGDVLDWWFCADDGVIPIHTRVDHFKSVRFRRDSQSNS
ncbi:MAG: hypothetical protein ACE5FL_07710 [Myxococcota bacterium]